MKHLLFLIMVVCSVASAQTVPPDPDFWIGAFNVSPHWNPQIRICQSVSGMLPDNPPPNEPF